MVSAGSQGFTWRSLHVLLAVWVPWGLAHVSVWQCPISGVCKQSTGFLGPLGSCDRGTNTQAENLALFKLYWTPCRLGLSTVAEEAVAWRWRWRAAAPCCCPPPQLCAVTQGKKGVWAEGRGWREIISPPRTLGWGPLYLHRDGSGPPVQLPHESKALGAAPHSQSAAHYVADTCPLASRTAARLRGPSVGAAPFFSRAHSWATSPSLESDSSTSLRTSFSI